MTVQEASSDAANQELADRSPSLAVASPTQALCDNLQQIPRACVATNNDEELLSHFNWHTLSFEDSACESSLDSYIFGTTSLYGDIAPYRVTGFNDDVNMADFLASFDFSGNSTAHPSERYCLHLEDVKARLRTELDGNVSASRAQLVETTIDIASRACLEMDAAPLDVNNQTGQTTSEVPGDNDPPPVAGAPSQSAPAKREVMASEAASNQPTQDPELQTAVSNSLMKAVSEVDACTWELESMALEKDGWTFGFACSQAWRCWTKDDNSLGALDICDFSKKAPEATAADRPAFDCCGTISVSFKRSNKTIKITYSHIPIHKTVGGLWQLFQPTEPPIPVLSPSPKKRTPAKAKPSVAGAKRSRKSGTEGGTTPKKRNRKEKDNGADPSGQLTLEHNMASLAQEVQRLSSTDSASNEQPSNRAIPPAALAAGSAAQAWSISGISAGEATRRREVAAKLLSDNGVDASTLSADQFSVLSNQAPDLQKRSIEMLVKYGAESLRIVQPGNKNATKTSFLTATNETPARPIIFQTSGKRQRTKSGVICFNCKASKSKVKCSKELPTCNICVQSGLVCEFPPPRPRAKKARKSEPNEEEEQNSDAEWEEDNDQSMLSVAPDEPSGQGYGAQTHLFPTSQPATNPAVDATSNSTLSHRYPQNSGSQQLSASIPPQYHGTGLHALAHAVDRPSEAHPKASPYLVPPESDGANRNSTGYPYTKAHGYHGLHPPYGSPQGRTANVQSSGPYNSKSNSSVYPEEMESQAQITYVPYSYNSRAFTQPKVPEAVVRQIRNNGHGQMNGRR